MVASKMDRQKVYDPIQRILHWWIGAAVMGLVSLGWAEKLSEAGTFRSAVTGIHIFLGFALSAGFAARLIWGVLGPRHARLSAFWHPKVWRGMIGRVSKPSHEEYGHDPVASIAYLIFYMLITVGIVTGLLLAGMRYDQGIFAKTLFDDLSWHEISITLHNGVLYCTTLFIVAHIIGLLRHEQRSGVPVAQSMVSGYQYRRTEKGGES